MADEPIDFLPQVFELSRNGMIRPIAPLVRPVGLAIRASISGLPLGRKPYRHDLGRPQDK